MSAEQVFTIQQLKRYSGEDDPRLYIAYQGVVYEVSDCPRWRTGMHERLHFAAQDLSGELKDAPHGAEVFQRPCVRRIGLLIR